jgi:hypothetical protein
MYDNYLMLNRITLLEFCKAEDNGLIQVLIALDDSADAIGLDYEDKEIIRQMLDVLPDRIKDLEKLSGNPTERAVIEKELTVD